MNSGKEMGERRPETGEPFRIPHCSAVAPVAIPATRSTFPGRHKALTRGGSTFKIANTPRASSLITTLLVLVVLSTIVVAFMQSMSVERSVAKSVKNKMQAELAAEAGLENFIASARSRVANDSYIVVATTNVNGTFSFIGSPTPVGGMPGRMVYTPLFSGGLNVTNTNLAMPLVGNTGTVLATNTPPLPKVLSQVNTEWVYLVDTNGKTNGRYAYWVEDLAGYIDAMAAGNSNGVGGKHIRSNGTSPSDIALYIAMEPTNTNGISTNAMKVIANRQNFLSSSTVLQCVQSNLASNTANAVAVSGISDLEQDIVPIGRAYASQGLFKTNINSFVTNTNVTGLASYISSNLPMFTATNRSGAAVPGTYLRNLAANMIDYADLDSDPTVGADFRGVDSYPFVTSYYQQFHWRNRTGGSIATASNYWYAKNGTWHCQIDVTTFVQLWNMHNKPVTSGVLQIHDSVDPSNPSLVFNRYSIYVAGNESYVAPEPVGTSAKTVDFSTSPLLANQYAVYKFGPVIYECDSGIGTASPRPNLTGASRPAISERDSSSGIDHDDSNYLVTFNGKVIDRPGSSTSYRLERKAGTLDREGVNNGPDWRGFMVGLRYDSGFPIPYETTFVLGDPRGNMYIDRELAANDYDANSSWWGRHFAYSLMTPPSGTWFGQQTLPSAWPDGGPVSQRAATIFELNPGGTATDERSRCLLTPFDIPAGSRPPNEPSKAISKISNSGAFADILELGNIYDPLKWRPDWITKRSGDSTVPADVSSMTNSWQSLDSIAMVAATNYVVPGTLRIGRAEYKTLNQDGTRSAQLLEIFACTNNPRIDTRGRVNINTASREILRALVAGLQSTNDPNCSPSAIRLQNRGYINEQDGNLFADTVISNRPFLTSAQLSWMTNSYGGFWGTTNQYSTNSPSQVPVVWNDSGREEFFRMVYNLSHVRSRYFRIWVSGESFDAQGKVRARDNHVWQVYFKPTRTASGVITDVQPVLTYENSF